MRTALIYALAFCLFAAAPLFPASDGTWWKLSLVTMAGANTADTATSLRCMNRCGQETNPIYGRQFGARGMSIKAAIVGGQAVAQWLIVRRHPKAARYFVPLNAGQAGVAVWAAQHNGRLR